jgi:hypothetical protein
MFIDVSVENPMRSVEEYRRSAASMLDLAQRSGNSGAQDLHSSGAKVNLVQRSSTLRRMSIPP